MNKNSIPNINDFIVFFKKNHVKTKMLRILVNPDKQDSYLAF